MTFGPTVRTMRSESTRSPGSRRATFVSAQARNEVSARPALSAPRRAWASASATGPPRGGLANTGPAPGFPAPSRGRDARAAARGAGAQTQSRRLPGRQRQHGVAVREQQLAVGHPDRVVSERLGVVEEADLVDVRHDADAEAHGPDLTW